MIDLNVDTRGSGNIVCRECGEVVYDASSLPGGLTYAKRMAIEAHAGREMHVHYDYRLIQPDIKVDVRVGSVK